MHETDLDYFDHTGQGQQSLLKAEDLHAAYVSSALINLAITPENRSDLGCDAAA